MLARPLAAPLAKPLALPLAGMGGGNLFSSQFLFRETTGDRYLGPSIAASWETSRGRIGMIYRRAENHLLDTTGKLYYRHASAPFTAWSDPIEILAVAGRDCRSAYPCDIDGDLYATYWTNNGTTCVAGILKSTDGGETWAAFATLPVDGNPVAATSDNVCVATATRWMVAGYRAADRDGGTYNDVSGYWLSTDSGANWTWTALSNVTNGGNECNIRRLADGSLVFAIRTVSVAPTHQIYRSWDNGTTWHERVYAPQKTWTDAATLGQCQPDIVRLNGCWLGFFRTDNSLDRSLIVAKSTDCGESWDELYRDAADVGDYMYGQWVQVPGENKVRLIYSLEKGNGTQTDVQLATVRASGSPPVPPLVSTAVCAIWDAPASGAVTSVTDSGSGAHTITPANLTGAAAGLKSNAYELASNGKFTIGTTASLNLLHDGSKFTAMWLVRSPVREGIFQLVSSNNTVGANNGISVTLDERVATGNKRQLRWSLRKGGASGGSTAAIGFIDYAWRGSEWFVLTLIQVGDAAAGSWKFYVNDRLVASPASAVGATAGVSFQAPVIGQYSTLSSTGNLRRFVVFDRVLTAAELRAMRAAMWEDLTMDTAP